MPNTLIPMVRKYRKGGASHKKGALPGRFPGASRGASRDFSCILLQVPPSSYDQLRSSTPSPLGLRMFSDLSTICVSWAVLTLAHTQLASISRTIRAISSGTQLLYRGHSRWSFKIEYYKHIHCQYTIPKASNSKAIFGHDALTQAILFSAPGHFHRCRSSRHALKKRMVQKSIQKSARVLCFLYIEKKSDQNGKGKREKVIGKMKKQNGKVCETWAASPFG